jgi:hypothetical protein
VSNALLERCRTFQSIAEEASASAQQIDRFLQKSKVLLCIGGEVPGRFQLLNRGLTLRDLGLKPCDGSTWLKLLKVLDCHDGSPLAKQAGARLVSRPLAPTEQSRSQ